MLLLSLISRFLPIVLLSSKLVLAKPSSIFSSEVVQYLQHFGYLETPSKNSAVNNLMSGEHVVNAVQNLQKFAHLNDTSGKLDEATLELLKRPRCGLPDHIELKAHSGRRKRFVVQGLRWPRTNLTWSLRKSPSNNKPNRDAIRSELRLALSLWAKDSKLTFKEVQRHDQYADLQVFFLDAFHGDGYPFDGPGSILAHAFFPGQGRGGDVHFDDDEHWSQQRKVENHLKTSIFAVAAHEFGHSLGLAHSDDPKSLMFPWYTSVPEDLRLPRDDREAIQVLYGANEEEYGAKNEIYDKMYEKEGNQYNNKNEDDDVINESNYEPINDQDEFNNDEKSRMCVSSDLDALAVIRGELFLFKGNHFWRVSTNEGLIEDPIKISSFWYGLPKNIVKIDAVYERSDHRIVFFVGTNFYVLEGNAKLIEGPIDIRSLGLPENVRKIDGATRWGWNGKTYLFADTRYWRLDEVANHVELDYPRDLSVWRGVPYHIDAVFQHFDGKTYFFKGKHFWQFDDLRMRVKKRKKISQVFMHCPDQLVKKMPRKQHKIMMNANNRIQALPKTAILALFFTFSLYF